MEDLSKKNKKDKSSIILKIVGVLPFIILGAFIYLLCTTQKTLWEGKIFYIVTVIILSIICFGLVLNVCLTPFYKKREKELELYGRPEKAKIVKVKLYNYNFVPPSFTDKDKFEYNHQQICAVGLYRIILEFKNRDGRLIRREHPESLSAAEVSALVKKGELDVKVYKNSCKLLEEIPAVTYDKDILSLNSTEVKVCGGLQMLSAKAKLIYYAVMAIFVSVLFVGLLVFPFYLNNLYKTNIYFTLFLPAVMFFALSVLLAIQVYNNAMVNESDYKVTVYGFSLLSKYKGSSKNTASEEYRYTYYIAFTANGKTYDKQIDSKTFSRLQIVQRLGKSFDIFVKGKKVLIDIDSLPIF